MGLDPIKLKARNKRYYQSEKGQATRKRAEASDKRKAYLKSEARKIAQKKYNQSKKNKICQKRYQENNKEKIKFSQRKFRKSKKSKILQTRYRKNKLITSIQFRLICNLRKRLWSAVRYTLKSGSAVRDLGCSIEQLKLHLESQFLPGMAWNNYGNKEGQWSIDHIIPLSRVDLTDREQLLKVVHYTNLQPMWHIDNLKKSNRI